MLVDILKSQKPPKWFWLLASLGLLWNLSGIEEFYDSINATVDSMVAAGFTPEQANLYKSLPVWTMVVFGIAVFCGAIGCALLLLRKKISVKILAISLIAFSIYYVSDILYGVFAVFGIDEFIVLNIALLSAITMFWLARRSDKNGHLK